MAGSRHWEQDKDSTLYVGNLDERCTDPLVWELMLQAGPVINVHLPKDRVTQLHQGYGFVEFGSEEDADYAAKIMNQIRLWGKPIRVNKASADKRSLESGGMGGGQGVGAELFVGNLDGMVDEKILFETFSRFGPLIAPPKVARDDNNLSKGYGFISYASFEASDDAIQNMHGQYLMNKEITVQYAYKKDGKGERHGDEAERSLAAQAKKHGVQVQIPAMPASLVMPSNTPSAPAALQPLPANGGPLFNGGGPVPPRPAQPPPTYNYGSYAASGGFYNGMPPPVAMYGGPPAGGSFYNAMPPTPSATETYGIPPPNRAYNLPPLPIPSADARLPARPPAPMDGYGGDWDNLPGVSSESLPGPGGLPHGMQSGRLPPPPPGRVGWPPGYGPGSGSNGQT